MYDIVVGRSKKDLERYGAKGTVLLGKHYVQMGQVTSLSNKIFLDVTRSHVVFVCGKRGAGKSFTMGVIAEGISDLPEGIKENIAVVILDTMGIYWTMKYPNQKEKDLLEEWGIGPKGLDINIFTPKGHFEEFKKKGIPADVPFSIRPDELDIEDWILALGMVKGSEEGVAVEKIITFLKAEGNGFSIDDIIKA